MADDEARFSAVIEEYHALIAARRAAPPDPEDDDNRREFLAVGPETGQLLALLARSLPEPQILELGTSFGYSTLWLASAARASGGHVATLELYSEKSAFAREMAQKAGLDGLIEYRVGDALEILPDLAGPWDFVLVDHWKPLYRPSFELLRPNLAPGAILVADNMIHGGGPGSGTDDYAAALQADGHFDSVILPVGSGVMVSRLAR